MAIESLEAALFFEPAPTDATVLRSTQGLIARLTSMDRIQLIPLDEEQQQIVDSADTARFEEQGRIIFFSNDIMRREVDPDWMLQLVYSRFEAPQQAMLNLSPLPSGGENVEPSWLFLTELLPIVVDAYQPSLALCNGMSTDEEIDHLPSFEELTPGELPSVVTPWIYIGPKRLNESLRSKLADLEVARSEPLGQGWLLQVVKKYEDKPARDVIKQLQALTSRRVRYTHTR